MNYCHCSNDTILYNHKTLIQMDFAIVDGEKFRKFPFQRPRNFSKFRRERLANKYQGKTGFFFTFESEPLARTHSRSFVDFKRK